MAGFKNLSESKKSEANIARSGRGDTEQNSQKKLRTKKILLNLTEDEYAILKEEADKLGMACNIYCRFKIFHN